MNVFAFTGNLGRDSELQTTASGTSLLSFSVAVTSGWGDKKRTTWVKVISFRSGTEALAQMLKKGSRVGVHGELTLAEWTDKEGNSRSTLEVVAQTIDLLDPKGSNAENFRREYNEQYAGGGSQQPGKPNFSDSSGDDLDEDIPF